MGAKCFPELCFATVKESSGNLMVVTTQQILNLHPLMHACVSEYKINSWMLTCLLRGAINQTEKQPDFLPVKMPPIA